jgi:hypothetical protein
MMAYLTAGSSHSWLPQKGIALPAVDSGMLGCAVPQVLPGGKAKPNDITDNKTSNMTPLVAILLSKIVNCQSIKNRQL